MGRARTFMPSRRDLSSLVFHFTRTRDNQVARAMGVAENAADAYDVLTDILRQGALIGSSNLIKGGQRCVCFTESPITELAATFHLAAEAAAQSKRPVKYEPYGVAVPKQWLFDQGGRPAIYQPTNDYNLLDPSISWRHVRYEPGNGIDFTWEREWRVAADHLELEREKTLVVVPSAQETFQLMEEFADYEPGDFDDDGNITGVCRVPTWMIVSLDLFGVSL